MGKGELLALTLKERGGQTRKRGRARRRLNPQAPQGDDAEGVIGFDPLLDGGKWLLQRRVWARWFEEGESHLEVMSNK